MGNRRVSSLLSLGGVLAASVVLGQEIPNWPAAPFWKPPGAKAAIRSAAASQRDAATAEQPEAAVSATSPLPFVAITPCRLMDTRNAGLPGAFGPPSLAADSARDVPVPSHPTCTGIPGTAGAYSLNITVTNTGNSPFGFLKVWPQGTSEPNVSTLNWASAGATIANAAIVPAGTGGGITVKVGNASADVIIDINGYYAGTLVTSIAAGTGASVSNPTGDVTVGIANLGVGTPQLADSAVTAAKLASNAVTAGAIAPGQAVKSVNGIFDNLTLTGTGYVEITHPTSQTLAIGVPRLVLSLNFLSDNVRLVAGNNVTITPSVPDNTLTISAASTGGGSLTLPFTGIGPSDTNGSVFTLFNSSAGGTGIQVNGGHGGAGGDFFGGTADPGNRGGYGIQARAGDSKGQSTSGGPNSAASFGGSFVGGSTDNAAFGGPGVIGRGGRSQTTENSGVGGQFYGGGNFNQFAFAPAGTGVFGISGEGTVGPGGYFLGNIRSNSSDFSSPGVVGVGAPHFGENAAPGGTGGEFTGGQGADRNGLVGPPDPKVGGDGVRGTGGGCFSAAGPCVLPGEGFGNGGVFQGTYGVVATGRLAPVRLVPAATGTGAPTAGQHLQGELYVDSAGALFYCRVGGTPGTWVTLAP